MAAAGFKVPLFGLALGACTSIHATERTFDGTSWRVTAVNGQVAPASDDRFYIAFRQSSFDGRFGCNRAQGTYQIVRNTIQPGITSFTQAACVVDAPAAIQPMTYERWAFETIRRPMRMRWRSEHHLTLSNHAGSIELELDR